MTVVHIVLFKFKAGIDQAHINNFMKEIKSLKALSCVKDNRLIVGGPSITDPIERSKGCQVALLSFHQNRDALATYQASKEHHRVTKELLWPFAEDVTRFDFEVAKEDEHMIDSLPLIQATNGTTNGTANGTANGKI